MASVARNASGTARRLFAESSNVRSNHCEAAVIAVFCKSQITKRASDAIRKHSIMVAEQVKLYGNENDLIERIKNDDSFGLSAMELEVLLDPVKFTGMAEYQCEKFVTETVKPLLEKNKQRVNVEAQVNV